MGLSDTCSPPFFTFNIADQSESSVTSDMEHVFVLHLVKENYTENIITFNKYIKKNNQITSFKYKKTRKNDKIIKYLFHEINIITSDETNNLAFTNIYIITPRKTIIQNEKFMVTI